ncbi:hypothetical protein [Acinetobacter calcoaceticus]|jgi:hypothetical protein|uniref:hypothetical protein n=1 Tax=Acinetobacter calcoaceticus TaxID=471 RepID=UPI0030082630
MSEELFSAIATLKGAQIQANYTLIASCIGAIGIVVGILLSWYTALHLQKVSRLAETRKTVYLEFAESYSLLLSGLQVLQIEKHSFQSELLNRIMTFSTNLDKVIFVCDTRTKKEVVDFVNLILPKIEFLMFELTGYFDLSQELENLVKRHSDSLDNLNILYHKLDELRINNLQDEREENIFKLIEFKIEDAGKLMQPIIDKEEAFDEKNNKITGIIKEFTEELNKGISNVMYLLRSEIGAKTDIKLDKSISIVKRV